MLRLIFAFLLALGCHIVLLIVQEPWSTDTPPVIMGEKAISLKLSVSTISKTQKTQSEDNKNDAQTSLHKEQETKPAKTIIKNVMEVPVSSTSVPSPQIKADVTEQVILKPQSQKKKYQPEIYSQPEAVRSNAEKTQEVKSKYATEKLQATSRDDAATLTHIDARPLYQLNPKPSYPQIARRRGWQGVVLLMVLVSMDGVAEQVSIHESSGYTILDDAALKVVQHWKFLPGIQDGVVTAMEVVVPVHFVLE
jgi:periplasmic protein TonB